MKKNLIKNIEAKAKVTGVAILMIMVTLSAVFVLLPQDSIVKATSISDFVSYKTITLNSSQVPSTLTNFPVLINITDSDLASDALGNGSDIAFFSATNVQLNHEIELFNGTSGELVAWVNVTSLTHDADTTIHMYYNDSDISGSAENVAGTWDSHYVGVWHLSDEGSTQNSSTGSHNGTESGTVARDTGIAGYGQYFNDSLTSYVLIDNHSDLCPQYITAEVWFISDVPYTDDAGIFCKGTTKSANGLHGWLIQRVAIAGRGFRNLLYTGTNSANDAQISGFSEDVWYYYALTYDETYILRYKDGVNLTGNATAQTDSIDYSTTDSDNIHLYVGRYEGGSDWNYFDGVIDECRFSNIARSSDWIKTTYNTIYNATDGSFFTVGSASETGSSFSLSGLDGNDRITWSGEAGETVWSNATSYGTLNISTNIISTDNCTDIFIGIADFDSVIDADNISIEVIRTDDGSGSWDGDVKSFSGVGSYNITINSTTWAENWCDGNNPFPIDGAGWTNISLEVRFKCAIPGGAGVGTYVNTSTSWNVLWKVVS